MKGNICLVTFSDNMDHQDVVYSMYHALKEKAGVYTVGLTNPKSRIAPVGNNNMYVNGPLRPGIEKKTFRMDILLNIARFIKKNNVRYLYFESQHIWNVPLMLLCWNCIKIQAVHDVIPHDGNKAMDLSNMVTTKLASHVILRNRKYKEELGKRLNIPSEKITCFDLWRPYPKQTEPNMSNIFLCFGRIRCYKGFDLLISIVERCPEIQFRVVGAPDEESMILVEQLKRKSNVDVIDKEVNYDEMVTYFCEASWLVLPYAAATQSGVIVDAYRFSKPVIAFDVGAISEQIVDGETGFLVPAGDVDTFANTIRNVARFTHDEYQCVVNNAYQFGYGKYAAEGVAEDFIRVIDAL